MSQETQMDEGREPSASQAATESLESAESRENPEILEAPLPDVWIEDAPHPDAAPSASEADQPVRRSFGRVLRIQEDAVAWVADFRPLGRDVQVRLNSPFQANPGHVLEYELKVSMSGGNRWNGVDTVFNFQPDLDAVLALDEGKGLSPEGLKWLLAAIARQPASLGRVFGPGGSLRLQQQIMERDDFPLPRTLLLAALRHPGLAGRAAHRLWDSPLRGAQEVTQVLGSTGPRDEGRWLERVERDHRDWLLEDLHLDPQQVLRAWRKSRDLRWLLQLPVAGLKEDLALGLLRAGLFGGHALPDEDAKAWAARLLTVDRRRLLGAAYRDAGRQPADDVLFQEAGDDFIHVLKDLSADGRWGEEARRRLMERGELGVESALELLGAGATGEARQRLLEIVAQAPATQRPELDDHLALECFQLGLSRADHAAGQALLDWVGAHAAVQAQVEQWLSQDATRGQGLEALCHAGDFTRSRVQGLLGRNMDEALRRRLVLAISRRNPERWEDRYLVNDAEAQAWRDAGAPLR